MEILLVIVTFFVTPFVSFLVTLDVSVLVTLVVTKFVTRFFLPLSFNGLATTGFIGSFFLTMT
ncbi:Uncharacterised protein [Clostridioides difficile]|nr:Uncharacterised protein [Clostridioides difficile]